MLQVPSELSWKSLTVYHYHNKWYAMDKWYYYQIFYTKIPDLKHDCTVVYESCHSDTTASGDMNANS